MRTRSPFPGMDPWLETYWASIHHTYIQDSRSQIAAQLPEGLFCEVEETVYDADSDGEFKFPTEPIAEMHITIRSLRGNEPLVTVVEIISPTNKLRAAARRQYKRKRRAYQEALANVVEIDLLRAGRPLIDVPLNQIPAEIQTPYKASVRLRADAETGEAGADYYPLFLREKLPSIHIPLRAGDRKIVLDLQRPIGVAYELGRYGMRVDYSKPPDPPLSPEDAAWAAELIAASE